MKLGSVVLLSDSGAMNFVGQGVGTLGRKSVGMLGRKVVGETVVL